VEYILLCEDGLKDHVVRHPQNGIKSKFERKAYDFIYILAFKSLSFLKLGRDTSHNWKRGKHFFFKLMPVMVTRSYRNPTKPEAKYI
jgi:hypothetical protein